MSTSTPQDPIAANFLQFLVGKLEAELRAQRIQKRVLVALVALFLGTALWCWL